MKNFPNGSTSNMSYRAVLFSATGELRPVAQYRDSGPVQNRGTVQVAPRKGDLIAQVEWDQKSGEEYSLLKVIEDHEGGESMYLAATPVSFNEQSPIWEMLKTRHPWLDGWLAPIGHGPSYLPDEAVGPGTF